MAGGPARDIRLGHHRAGRGVCRRARPQGHAARGAPLDARRHRAQLHLARLPVPNLCPSSHRPDDARDRHGDVLRPGAVQGASSRRRRRGECRHAHRLDDGARARGCAAGGGDTPSAGAGLRRSVRLARRWAPRAVSLGHRRDEPLQRPRLAPEHRIRRGGRRQRTTRDRR